MTEKDLLIALQSMENSKSSGNDELMKEHITYYNIKHFGMK